VLRTTEDGKRGTVNIAESDGIGVAEAEETEESLNAKRSV